VRRNLGKKGNRDPALGAWLRRVLTRRKLPSARGREPQNVNNNLQGKKKWGGTWRGPGISFQKNWQLEKQTLTKSLHAHR